MSWNQVTEQLPSCAKAYPITDVLKKRISIWYPIAAKVHRLQALMRQSWFNDCLIKPNAVTPLHEGGQLIDASSLIADCRRALAAIPPDTDTGYAVLMSLLGRQGFAGALIYTLESALTGLLTLELFEARVAVGCRLRIKGDFQLLAARLGTWGTDVTRFAEGEAFEEQYRLRDHVE